MGGEMGNEGGDRGETRNGKEREASTIVACILREVDHANAYVVELREAVSCGDGLRAATVKAELDTAWKNAQSAIARLEQLSGRREIVARAALAQSQVSARGVSIELWKLVTSGSAPDRAVDK
jgi:hypothetical protein